MPYLPAAIAVGMLAIWRASKRLEFTWRMSWLAAAFVVICVSTASAGMDLAGGIAGGLFTLVHGIAAVVVDVAR